MALMIAGSHPKCRKDGTADVVLPSNKRSLFNLVNQVLLREMRDEPLLAVQVRALGPRPGLLLPQADALVSFSDGSIDRGTLGILEARLVSLLDAQRLGWTFVDGGPSTRGYEVQGSAQALYLGHTRNKKFAALWLSPFARLGFRTSADNAVQEKQLQVLGIGTEERGLDDVLAGSEQVSSLRLPDEMVRLVEHYQKTQDIASLDGILNGWPALRLRRIIDKESQRPFLVFQDGTTLLPLVAALDFTPLLGAGQSGAFKASLPFDRQTVRRFVSSGEALLRTE
jgi:hypothetical protein